MQRFMGLILLSGLYKIAGLALLLVGIAGIFLPNIPFLLHVSILNIVLAGSSLYGLGLLINVLLSIEESLREMRNFFRQRSKPKPE